MILPARVFCRCYAQAKGATKYLSFEKEWRRGWPATVHQCVACCEKRRGDAGSYFLSRVLVFLTAASAKPFDSGWYGEESSWWIKKFLQNFSNSEPNWGPPSDRIVSGQPSRLNQLVSLRKFFVVDVLPSLSQQRKPVSLSTRMIQSSEWSINKSAAQSLKLKKVFFNWHETICFLFWDGTYSWQDLQLLTKKKNHPGFGRGVQYIGDKYVQQGIGVADLTVCDCRLRRQKMFQQLIHQRGVRNGELEKEHQQWGVVCQVPI